MADEEEEEERMLTAMGQIAKAETDAVDSRLERFAFGELSAEEEAKLRTEAKADHRLGLDVALHHPMSAEARDRFFEAAASGRRASPKARVIRPQVWAVVPALALAASIAVMVLMPSVGAASDV